MIEVVGRFIKNDEMGMLLWVGGKDDFDMLIIGEIVYVGVRDKFGIEIEVGVVSFDFFVYEGMELIGGKGFFYIDIGNYFLMGGEEFGVG